MQREDARDSPFVFGCFQGDDHGHALRRFLMSVVSMTRLHVTNLDRMGQALFDSAADDFDCRSLTCGGWSEGSVENMAQIPLHDGRTDPVAQIVKYVSADITFFLGGGRKSAPYPESANPSRFPIKAFMSTAVSLAALPPVLRSTFSSLAVL